MKERKNHTPFRYAHKKGSNNNNTKKHGHKKERIKMRFKLNRKSMLKFKLIKAVISLRNGSVFCFFIQIIGYSCINVCFNRLTLAFQRTHSF